MSIQSQVTKAIYNQMDDGLTNTVPTNRQQRRVQNAKAKGQRVCTLKSKQSV